MPNTFCETPEGNVLIADGWGPVLAWNGFDGQAKKAGVPAPTAAPGMTFSGSGKMLGQYRAFVRWLDSDGFPSNLTPISAAETTASSKSGLVTGATSTSPIALKIVGHTLTTGSRIKVLGVGGQRGADGTWDITVIDADHVFLQGSFSNGVYNGGGTWISGAGTVTYTGLEQPQDPRVKRRQILRNTDGQQGVFYVDIDTADLTSPSLSSTKDDDQLQTSIAVPLLDDNGAILANLHGEPPNNKPYIAYHQNRVFLAGDVNYTEGAVKATFGSATVTGIGTEWRPEAAGRFIYIVGADKPYTILSVQDASTLTLTAPYKGSTLPYALYAIRSAQADQRTVWYSDSTHTQGFSPIAAFALAEDGDEITGLLSYDSFIFVLEYRHVYKFTYQNNPQTDGALFRSSDRGCINQRCAVLAKGGVYMLDAKGVHLFGRTPSREGDDSDISAPIQTMFRPEIPGPKINFDAARFFHGCLDQSIDAIRWFVAMSGTYLPRHAICYQYLLDRWWIEEYPQPIGCSFTGRIYRRAPLETWGTGRLQTFYGGTGRRVFAHATSPLDGLAPRTVYQAPCTNAGYNWLQTPASLPAGVGYPVVITAGRGEGQRRIVTKISSGKVYVRDPWRIRPDSTSTLQFGGVQWSWKSGWLRWVEEESTNPRNVEVAVKPSVVPDTITLRRYTDRSEVPDNCALDRYEDGVTCKAGDPNILLSVPDLPGGFSQALMFQGKQGYTRGPQVVSLGLSGVGGIDQTNVYQINLDGAVSPGMPPNDNNPAT